MNIDVQTLIVILVIAGVLESIAMAFEYSLNRDYRGLVWWTWSFFIFGLGYFFFAFRDTISVPLVTIVLSNFLFILGMLLLYTGLSRFLDLPENRWFIFITLAVFLAVFMFFTLVEDNITLRGGVISLTFIAISLVTAMRLLFHRPPEIRDSALFVFWILVVFSFFHLLRLVEIIFTGRNLNIYDQGSFQVMTFLVPLVISVLLTIGLIIMINQRLNSEIRRSRDHFKLLFSSIPDAAAVTRIKDRIIIDINDGFTRLFGYTVPETANRDSNLLNLWPDPEERLRLYAELTQKGLVMDFRANLCRKDGSLFTGIISARIIDLENGPHIITLTRDISERLEAQVRLNEAYEEEKKLRLQLEEEAAARIQFIDVLAHELKGPLSPMLASSEMLRDASQSQPGGIIAKLADNLFHGTQLLINRLDELLEVARFGRGNVKMNLATLDTRRFLEQVAARYQPSLAQRRQQLILDISFGLPSARFDPSRLEQVLVNLLSNASKYSPEQSRIFLTAGNDLKELHIAVRDEGIGISPEDQKSLFRPYQRVGRNRDKIKGLGLGLTVVRYIIEAHGGRIDVKSAPEQGSTFTFHLPLMPEA